MNVRYVLGLALASALGCHGGPHGASAVPVAAPEASSVPGAARAPSFDGTLPAPNHAVVVAESRDGSVLLFLAGRRAPTARERNFLEQKYHGAPAPLPSDVTVHYYAVLDAARGCITQTLATPGFDELVESNPSTTGPSTITAEVRGELDQLGALAARFGTHTLPDSGLAFGTTPARSVFQSYLHSFLLSGTTASPLTPSTLQYPRASPSGTTLAAAGCEGTCSTQSLRLLVGAATATRPGPPSPTHEFRFRDEDSLVYVTTDANRSCVREYLISARRDREVRCIASEGGELDITLSKDAAFAVAAQRTPDGSYVLVVLQGPAYAEAWRGRVASRPFSLQVDARGRLLYSVDHHGRWQAHLQGATQDQYWDEGPGAGTVGSGDLLQLRATNDHAEEPIDVALERVRCSAFEVRVAR